MPLNGVINYYKPPGMTSAQAVAFIRRLVGQKAGHAGTLDPEAAGVLPLVLGKATRISEILMAQPKQYLAEIAFTGATDTQDAQGRVIQAGNGVPDAERLAKAAQRFLGEVLQLPPQYSALKVAGKAAYALAREGKQAELQPRLVRFDAIDLVGPMRRQGCLLRVRCGKGAYIRTLCHDLGQMLGCPAHMRFLLREEAGGLRLADAATMEDLQAWQEAGLPAPAPWFTGLDRALPGLPRLEVPPAWSMRARSGMALPVTELAGADALPEHTRVCLFLDGALLGIYTLGDGLLRVSAMLWEPGAE